MIILIFYITLFRATYAMLTAPMLPKGTDVSFITEMIEVIELTMCISSYYTCGYACVCV